MTTTEKRTKYPPFPEASEADLEAWMKSPLRDKGRAGNPLEGYPSSYAGKALQACTKAELQSMLDTCRQQELSSKRKRQVLAKALNCLPI